MPALVPQVPVHNVRPRLAREPPKQTPPVVPGYGKYCFRAVVLVSKNDRNVARVVGYDTDPEIGEFTEKVAKMFAPRVDPALECGPASLTLLRKSHGECSGQVFWQRSEDGGDSVRLVG